jgi:hypothetical protein
MHALEKLWKAAYVFHAEGSLEADLWVMDRTLRILEGGVLRRFPEMTHLCSPEMTQRF